MEKDEQVQAIAALLEHAAYPKQAHYALAALQDVRALVGHVPEAALPLIAESLDMDPAALAALMRDSAQFTAPSEARHRLSVCQGAVCIGRGGGDLLASAREKFASMPGLTVVAGHCLGQCLQAPAASLDEAVFAPVDLADLARRVALLEG